MPNIAGLAVSRQDYPAGQGGPDKTIAKVVAYIHEGRSNALARQFAEGIINQAGYAVNSMPTHRQIMQAFLDYMRDNVRYRPDAHMTETVQQPMVTLCVPGAAACIPVGDCFPEGTLLLRDDLEFIPIEKIKEGERIWGRDKWTRIESVAFKGKLTVDALMLNNGATLYLTPDHKLYVGKCRHGLSASACKINDCQGAAIRHLGNYERERVRDVEKGDVLLQPERIAFGTRVVDPERLYVEGLALADGWVRDTGKSFYVAGRDGMRKEAQKHEVKAICGKLGIETRWHRRYIEIKDPVWAMRIKGLGERARFKHLETLNLCEASAEAALRGVMADSAANTHGGGRTYSTTSPMLWKQVRVLQKMFGQTTSVVMLTPEQHGGAGKFPLWRLAVRGPSKKSQNRALIISSIERAVRKVPCWDIATADHYVYLPEHDVTVSNCDDGTATLGWLATAYGIPVRLLIQHFGNDTDHVLLEFQNDDGQWLACDFSNFNSANNPVGWKPNAQSEYRIDPFSKDNTRVAGVRDVEFVAIGKVPHAGFIELPKVTLGRLPMRYVGAVSPAGPLASFETAATDLANQVTAVIAAGDTYASAATPELASALSSYKAAGNAGATIVGPEIDLAGAAWATQPLTHQAWVSNGDLQAIATADAASVARARLFVSNMQALWRQAINNGTTAVLEGRTPPATPGVRGALGVVLLLGFIGGIGYAYSAAHPRRRR